MPSNQATVRLRRRKTTVPSAHGASIRKAIEPKGRYRAGKIAVDEGMVKTTFIGIIKGA